MWTKLTKLTMLTMLTMSPPPGGHRRTGPDRSRDQNGEGLGDRYSGIPITLDRGRDTGLLAVRRFRCHARYCSGQAPPAAKAVTM
jgi:hypothetical protein